MSDNFTGIMDRSYFQIPSQIEWEFETHCIFRCKRQYVSFTSEHEHTHPAKLYWKNNGLEVNKTAIKSNKQYEYFMYLYFATMLY